MTYCLGLYLEEGLVLLADTRTTAGVDDVATHRKMHVWEKPGERVVVLMTAGNLAVTQSVVNLLNEGLELPEENGPETLMTVPSMYRAAALIGAAVREIYRIDGPAMEAQHTDFTASFLLAGQLQGRTMRLFQIYTAGNFISASPETPFLQIGEHKYGKPILDRAAVYDKTSLRDGVKLSLISMDSTIRSNLSVGFPLDLVVYRKDSLKIDVNRRIDVDDPYIAELSQGWSQALRQAYADLPEPDY